MVDDAACGFIHRLFLFADTCLVHVALCGNSVGTIALGGSQSSVDARGVLCCRGVVL